MNSNPHFTKTNKTLQAEYNVEKARKMKYGNPANDIKESIENNKHKKLLVDECGICRTQNTSYSLNISAGSTNNPIFCRGPFCGSRKQAPQGTIFCICNSCDACLCLMDFIHSEKISFGQSMFYICIYLYYRKFAIIHYNSSTRITCY